MIQAKLLRFQNRSGWLVYRKKNIHKNGASQAGVLLTGNFYQLWEVQQREFTGYRNKYAQNGLEKEDGLFAMFGVVDMPAEYGFLQYSDVSTGLVYVDDSTKMIASLDGGVHIIDDFYTPIEVKTKGGSIDSIINEAMAQMQQQMLLSDSPYMYLIVLNPDVEGIQIRAVVTIQSDPLVQDKIINGWMAYNKVSSKINPVANESDAEYIDSMCAKYYTERSDARRRELKDNIISSIKKMKPSFNGFLKIQTSQYVLRLKENFLRIEHVKPTSSI